MKTVREITELHLHVNNKFVLKTAGKLFHLIIKLKRCVLSTVLRNKIHKMKITQVGFEPIIIASADILHLDHRASQWLKAV